MAQRAKRKAPDPERAAGKQRKRGLPPDLEKLRNGEWRSLPRRQLAAGLMMERKMVALKMDGSVRVKRQKALKPLPMEIAAVFRDGYLAAVGRAEVSTNSIVYGSPAYQAGWACGKKVGDDHKAADAELDAFARTIGCTWQTA